MAHPNLRVLDESLEQRILLIEMLQVGTTILTAVSSLHLTALGVREELSTVADAEYRNAADKLAQINLESFRIMNGIGLPLKMTPMTDGSSFWKLVVGMISQKVSSSRTRRPMSCGSVNRNPK